MDRGSTPLSSTNASSLGLKRTKKQGVRHKCHSLFLWLAPCLALRSVPLMGTEIVTRLYLDISISRHSLSAIAIPSRTLSAPYNSPQLHQRFEPRLKANQKTGSTAQVPLPFSLARPLPRSPLRSADGHRNRDAIVPRYLHISAFPIGNRYSVADSVRSLQLPSAPPTLRACARSDPTKGVRHKCRSLFLWLAPCLALRSVPLAGSDRVTLRYSVLASLVLTSNSSRLSLSAKTTYCPFL